MLPPECHLLFADGALSTRAVRTGQLHVARQHRIQFGHCRLALLFPIAQLIEIAFAGMPFASRMVVSFDGRAGLVTANPPSELSAGTQRPDFRQAQTLTVLSKEFLYVESQYFAAILRFLTIFAHLHSNHEGKQLNFTGLHRRGFLSRLRAGSYLCHPGFAYSQQGRLRISGPYLDCEHFSCAGNWIGLFIPLG
jgi:hypothetical protein